MTLKTWSDNVQYEYIGAVSESDADELISFAGDIEQDVRNRLKAYHPDLWV